MVMGVIEGLFSINGLGNQSCYAQNSVKRKKERKKMR
jgi:hypothetical protein